MDENTVVLSYLMPYLSDGLQEGLALDITSGSPDFGNDYLGFGLPVQCIDCLFYLRGYMGNDLDGGSQVGPTTFLAQYVPVHPSAGEVAVLVQVLINESLVVSKVEVGL